MKRFVGVVIVFLAVLRIAPSLAEDREFPLGIWYEGAVGDLRHGLIPADPAEAAKMYNRDFADIAAHGIDTVVVPNATPAHHKQLLDAAQANHLKLILELGVDGGLLGKLVRGQEQLGDDGKIIAFLKDALDPIKEHPALLRVQILDEPPAGTFDRYAKVADTLRAYDPKHGPFCCLVGSGDGDKFLKETRSDVIAWDFYPIGPNNKAGDIAPLKAVDGVAVAGTKAALKYNADAYAVLQCHAIPGALRFPTPAEIRCMSYLSLAAGNRGVFWFLYQTEYWNFEAKQKMEGLVDSDFKPSDRWAEVSKLTKEIRALIPALKDCKPSEEQPKSPEKASIRALEDSKGKHYLFVVNLDTQNAQKIPVRGTSRDAEATVSRLPDEAIIESTRDGQDVLWTAEIAAGSGALFRVN